MTQSDDNVCQPRRFRGSSNRARLVYLIIIPKLLDHALKQDFIYGGDVAGMPKASLNGLESFDFHVDAMLHFNAFSYGVKQSF